MATKPPYLLPKLPYPYDALEPYIDGETMRIHYTKHHQGYLTKLNYTLKELQNLPDSLEELFQNIVYYPAFLRNNAGGHWNHTFFWETLSPKPTKEPTSPLKKAIERDFKTLGNCIHEISTRAGAHFGAGWAWLCINEKSHHLTITTTQNQDNPFMYEKVERTIPLLGIDLWEHAYYLKYKNQRKDYIAAIWNVIDWATVSRRYQEVLENPPDY